jgi:hypothetical protein
MRGHKGLGKAYVKRDREGSTHIYLLTYLLTTATRYGLGGGGRDFPLSSRPALGGHPPAYTKGTGSFPGVKRAGRSVDYRTPFYCRGQRKGGAIPPLLLGPQACIGIPLTFFFLLQINISAGSRFTVDRTVRNILYKVRLSVYPCVCPSATSYQCPNRCTRDFLIW